MMNILIFDATKKEKYSKNFYRIMGAWKELASKQLEDEQFYTESILDINDWGKLFDENAPHKELGRRGKDLIYGFWNEEDIRIKLAAELMWQSEHSRVHGQIHIKGEKNKKQFGRRRKDHLIRKFPDLFFMSLKKKEFRESSSEPNLETSSIEIKYFTAGLKKRDIRWAILTDLDKLISYQKRTLTPKADSGYFFCIDESGKAEAILKEALRMKRYKHHRIGYGLIIPCFTKQKIKYPRYFEKFPRKGCRKISYLLNLTMGKLSETNDFSLSNMPKWDNEFFCSYCCINKRHKYRGMVLITKSNNVEGINSRYWPVLLYIPKIHNKQIKKEDNLYGYSNDCKKYVSNVRNRNCLLVYKILKSKCNSLEGIEVESRKLAKILKKEIPMLI
jgi:hypothetical protein